MTNLETFKNYLAIEARLANVASKDELLDCARLLALNVAHYELKYGQLPLEDSIACLEADVPSDEQLQMLNLGMQTLVGLLGNVIQGLEKRDLN